MSEDTRNTKSRDELTVDDLAKVAGGAPSIAVLPAVVGVMGSWLQALEWPSTSKGGTDCKNCHG